MSVMWLGKSGVFLAMTVFEVFRLSNAKAQIMADHVAVNGKTGGRRQERAVQALELPSLDWNSISSPTTTSSYSASLADQLFFEGQAPPSAPLARQVPIPPPPLSITLPSITSPISIYSVLQALLPLLAMSSFGGYNSEEGGGLLLPFLLSSLGGGDGLLPGLAPGSALPLGSPPFLFRYRKDPPVIIRQNAPKKALSSSGHGSQIALLKCTPVPRPKVCDDLPFDKILTIGNAILAIKNQRVYRFDLDGTLLDDQAFDLDPALRGITAAVNMRDSDYLFQGERYHKYQNGLKQGLSNIEFRRIKNGFPGLRTPVDGIFQLDDHTFVSVSGTRFQSLYPDDKSPIKMKEEAPKLSEIIGAPRTIDSAFFMNNRTILHKNDMLYEMEPGQLKVAATYPLRSPIEGEGWMHCPEERLNEATGCTVSLNDVPAPSQNLKARNKP